MNKLKCKAKNKEASETSPTIDISEFLLGKNHPKITNPSISQRTR